MTPVDPVQGHLPQRWAKPGCQGNASRPLAGPAAAPAEEAGPDRELDLEPIRQALLRDTRGSVTLARIDDVLRRLLAQDFHDVRLPTYLPIFLLRAARQTLRVDAR